MPKIIEWVDDKLVTSYEGVGFGVLLDVPTGAPGEDGQPEKQTLLQFALHDTQGKLRELHNFPLSAEGHEKLKRLLNGEDVKGVEIVSGIPEELLRSGDPSKPPPGTQRAAVPRGHAPGSPHR